ncbi:Phospholipase YtpA [Phytophthora cinnamomi]|uniref:Phospholipase YtpA n=1 Tax=Phytophthora cinnamomi TaxID=4785 RepID=UPI003559941D|nr:Phospholipase YtpA [Phytophthora cinnamomi]
MAETIRLPTGATVPETAIKHDDNKNRKRTIRFMDDEALDATELSSGSGSTTPPPTRSTSSSRFSSGQTDIPLRFRRYEGKFENSRGQSLFYFALFPPERMPMRGVVLYVHGSSSHCRRHIELYKELCKTGFGVISYDMVNHGASDLDEHKTRAHISNFQYLVDDTNAFITYAKRSIYTDALRYWRKYHYPHHPHGKSSNIVALPEPPLIIAGSSLGSLVGIHTVLTARHKFHAAVWAAPTIGVTWNPLLYAESLLPLAMFIPKARIVPAVSHDLFCRDPAFLEAFKNDPLTCTARMTVRSGTEALNAIKRLQKDTRVTQSDSTFCSIPMLFIAGSNDGVSDQQAAIRFFASIANQDKEFKLIQGGFHFVFEDTQKEAAIEHLTQWLRARFPLETRNAS